VERAQLLGAIRQVRVQETFYGACVGADALRILATALDISESSVGISMLECSCMTDVARALKLTENCFFCSVGIVPIESCNAMSRTISFMAIRCIASAIAFIASIEVASLGSVSLMFIAGAEKL